MDTHYDRPLPVDEPTDGLPLLTARLRIRPVVASDRRAFDAIYQDEAAMRFIPGGVRDAAGVGQRVAELIDHHRCHGVSKWAVELHATGEVLGDCGLQFLTGTDVLELGFHFAPAHWGQGYASEAAAACLHWARAHRPEPIVAIVDPAHHAYQTVLGRIGMRPTRHDHLLGQQ